MIILLNAQQKFAHKSGGLGWKMAMRKMSRFFRKGRARGGSSALERNLLNELGLQSRVHWAAGDWIEPAGRPIDAAWILSSLQDLQLGLELKKRGMIRELWAGPNLVVVPREAGDLLNGGEIDRYIVPCDWVASFYAREAPVLRDKLVIWPVGVDVNYWTGAVNVPKQRLVIYNKNQTLLASRIIAEMKLLNIEVREIRYGHYEPEEYRDALREAWGMVWLSQSETQGLACLEALSMNVPVLAWDPGTWTYASPGLRKSFSCPASSVPYFDAACGIIFKTLEEFPAAFAEFSKQRNTFRPRDWLLRQRLDLASNLARLPLPHTS